MTPSTELQRPSIKTELPGPKSREIIEADAQYVTPSYPRPDYKLVADHASGVWITDPDGNVFLDCNAGVAVCSTGHCHPEVVAAIQQQVTELIHLCGTDFYYKQMPDLGKKLDEICPIDGETKTHFANSGAEAVETALKLAMYHTKHHSHAAAPMSNSESKAKGHVGDANRAGSSTANNSAAVMMRCLSIERHRNQLTGNAATAIVVAAGLTPPKRRSRAR